MRRILALGSLAFLAIGAFLVAGSAFAGHNGADVEIAIGDCGETTLNAGILDPDGTHKVSNMYLVVSADGTTQFVNIPIDSTTAEIVVGPFAQDTTIYWNVFGGGERSYDQPLWNGFGTPTFSADIAAYAADQGGFGWVLDGPEDPNPFTNFNAVPVEGCKDDCKNGGWEDLGFRNQGQCIRFVNTGQDSRD